jgi:Flp pilus assembly protein TadB
MAEPQRSSSREDQLAERVRELERRIKAFEKRLEKKGEVLGKGVEAEMKEIQSGFHRVCHHGHSLFWGIVLVVVGLIWLGNNLGWFMYEIPWIPVIMIAGGIYMILRNWEKEELSGKKSAKKDK